MQVRSHHPLLLALSISALSTSVAAADVTTVSDPVAPPQLMPDGTPADGTGLCMASAVSTMPATDFGALNETNYNEAMNTFMEQHELDRTERVIPTALDLSNNYNGGANTASLGDFRDAVAGCLPGGCSFDVNDGTTSFGARLRGYLNVPPDWVDREVHFGLYADDAVSLTIFDRNNNQYPVLVIPPSPFAPTWRATDTVTFTEAGLYPIEILHTELAEHAALELSYRFGPYTDFQQPADQPPVVSLADEAFQLLPETVFFQSESGAPSFPGLDECEQCNRNFVNLPGAFCNNEGYLCNSAALCAPCEFAYACGPSCSQCGGDTPLCSGAACVQCLGDDDCQGSATCDMASNTCLGTPVDAGVPDTDAAVTDPGDPGAGCCQSSPPALPGTLALGLLVALGLLTRTRRRDRLVAHRAP